MQKLIGTIIIILGIAIAQWKKGKFIINEAFFFVVTAALCYAISDVISFNILRTFDAISFNVYFAILTLLALLIVKPGTIQNGDTASIFRVSSWKKCFPNCSNNGDKHDSYSSSRNIDSKRN